MQVARLFSCLAATIVSCGGGTTEDSPTQADAGSDAPVADKVDVADTVGSDLCKTASGVRFCGGGCPLLSSTECPGLGCVPIVHRVSGAPTGTGICIADLPPPITPCWLCTDGMTCAHVAGQGPICVEEDVCRSLHALGLDVGCRFSDFSHYDGRPLAVAEGTGCPANSCGPGCGECEGPARCSGRSADFGYGLCLHKQNPVPCSAHKPLPESCGYCLTWGPAAGGDELALDNGQCVPGFLCAEYEATGRMKCH